MASSIFACFDKSPVRVACDNRSCSLYERADNMANISLTRLCNSTKQGFHSLNYAACHDCVLLPETSCEFRNVLLDLISIVGKLDNPDLGLMGQIAASVIQGE